MPGCGKSTIGVLLAKKMMYSFLDSDLVLQQRAGKRLYQIIRDDGQDAFSRLEDEVNSSFDVSRTVIATGGSAVYWNRSMEHLQSIADIVYIRIPYEELTNRIRDFATRGIYIPDGKTFLDVYNERVPLYEQYADITVDSGTGPTWETVETMYAAIAAFRKESGR